MNTATVVIGIVVLAVVLLVYVWWSVRRRSSLPASVTRKLFSQWQHVGSLSDASRQVLEAEKVADALLTALGYTGTFADKLRQAGSRLKNVDAVWTAHKVRNQIAHEPGFHVSAAQASSAVHAFARLLRAFGVRV